MLPYTVEDSNISEFFSGLDIQKLEWVNDQNGQFTGYEFGAWSECEGGEGMRLRIRVCNVSYMSFIRAAVVTFGSREDAEKAAQKNREEIGGRSARVDIHKGMSQPQLQRNLGHALFPSYFIRYGFLMSCQATF